MILRHRFATFSLLLFGASFLFRPLQATGERAAGRPLAESLTASNSARLRQAAQPGQTASPQSHADEVGPLFPVEEHGKWGYIDKTGKIVISPEYYDANPFIEGLALIQPFPVLGRRAIRVLIIDKSGKMVGSKIYAYAQAFSEGLALVVIAGEEKSGYGYIDKTGKMVTSRYDFAKSFSEGLAAVKDGGKWGYIDKTGKMVIPPQFSEAYRFSEGLATVKDGGQWGYIDKTGKMVIPPQYDLAYQHSEGLAAVKTGGKWGFIDSTGQMVIPPQFSDTFGFSEGLVSVELGKNGATSTKPVRW